MRAHMYKFPSDWRHIHLPPDTEVKAITLLIRWHMCNRTISPNPTTHTHTHTHLHVMTQSFLYVVMSDYWYVPIAHLTWWRESARRKGGGGEKEKKEEETWCRVWGQLKGWVTRLMSRQVAPLQKQPHTLINTLTHTHIKPTLWLGLLCANVCVCVQERERERDPMFPC